MDRSLELLINNLRVLIDGSGMTQQEVSEKAGLRPAYLNQIIKGRNHSPHLENLVALCKVLNTTLPALFIDPNLPPPVTPVQAWVVIRAFLDTYFFMQPKGHAENTYQARSRKDEP